MNECPRCHSTQEPAAILRDDDSNGYSTYVCADCGEYTAVEDE